MKWMLCFLCLPVVLMGQTSVQNQLTKKEEKEGWYLLFNGKAMNKWKGINSDEIPGTGWKIENNELIVMGGSGDIITKEKFSNFDLKVDFKITPGANSGIKYFVELHKDTAKNNFYPLGLEYQILDDDKHPDAKLGSHEGSRTVASLYDLIKAQDKKVYPVGEWNHAEIISKGNHVEHWLNGKKVLEYERSSAEYRKLVLESKYKNYQGFGEATEGYILLQDHGNEVHFCNIKIKKL
jgi:hypothetical protein